MALFKYKAISQSGAPVDGVIEAKDATEAVILLKETCSVIDDLKEVKKKETLLQKTASDRIKEKNLALSCKQFAIILSSGLPIVRTVELVAGQTSDKVLNKIFTNVAEEVAAGNSLADSFQKHGPKLPVTFIESIRAGEETGRLDLTFERLSKYFHERQRTKAKVISSLTYPCFVIAVAVIVVIIIMAFAVPVFTDTFVEMGTELPLPTKILIATSDFFSKYILLILALLAGIVAFFVIYNRTDQGNYNLSKLVLKLPIIGKVQYMNAVSQYANTFSTMITAGLPVTQAMNITGRSMSNRYMGESVMNAVAGIEEGYSVSSCLRKENTMPPLLIEMVGVGEESGELADTLAVIGEYYDNEVDTVTTRAVGLLEPIIICCLAVFVCCILLAVYLPMFSMYDNFNGQF